MKTYAAQSVANWFINKSRLSGRNDMSHLKLQKLLYLAHGWSLAIDNRPLLNEPIHAGPFGPLVPSLFMTLEKSKSNILQEIIGVAHDDNNDKITPHTYQIDKNDEFVQKLLERIWEVYNQWTPIQCSSYCHKEGSPWDQVVEALGQDRTSELIMTGIQIPDSLIRQYFITELESSDE